MDWRLGSVDNSHWQPEKCESQWHDALVMTSQFVISGGDGPIILESGKRVLHQMSELVQRPVESLIAFDRIFLPGNNKDHQWRPIPDQNLFSARWRASSRCLFSTSDWTPCRQHSICRNALVDLSRTHRSAFWTKCLQLFCADLPCYTDWIGGIFF